MINLRIPFSLTDIKQIPVDLIGKENLTLEGNVFDARFFKKKGGWNIARKNIDEINKTLPRKLASLHFPVENANYIDSNKTKDSLFKFIDLANESDVPLVVLHSNYIQRIEGYYCRELPKIRKKFLEFFRELDISLKSKNVVVCIENMPIIGNDGDDFDSVFVFPEDFQRFNFRNIKIVWDFSHWAYTCFLIKRLSNITERLSSEITDFDEFLKIRENIVHTHFSSFKAKPLGCEEGIMPKKGSFDAETFIKILKKLNEGVDISMTLEIKDENYRNRVNLFETIKWFKKYVY